MWTYFTILILFLTSHNVASKKKSRSLYFLAVKYNKDSKYLNNFELTINKDNTSINILMDINEDLNNLGCSANISLWLKPLEDYKQIISYDINVCQHLERVKIDKTNILNAWTKLFFKFGNITKSCPVAKNLYYIANLKPDKDSLPSFIPAGRCRIISTIYNTKNNNKEVIGSTEIDIELK